MDIIWKIRIGYISERIEAVKKSAGIEQDRLQRIYWQICTVKAPGSSFCLMSLRDRLRLRRITGRLAILEDLAMQQARITQKLEELIVGEEFTDKLLKPPIIPDTPPKKEGKK